MLSPEQLVGEEWAEWYRLSPVERWLESEKLWQTYLALGGSLDPEPDTQSPFFDAHASRRALLMGRQACVFYGAAEFSRDTDFAILADAANLVRLRKALSDLKAQPIAVPPFDLKYLKRGHALHFLCQHPEALRMRVDIMSKMRGVEAFRKLWKRRTTLELPDGTRCELLSLPDLVEAKKPQRDKDWPMIRRLACLTDHSYRRPHHVGRRAGPDEEITEPWKTGDNA